MVKNSINACSPTRERVLLQMNKANQWSGYSSRIKATGTALMIASSCYTELSLAPVGAAVFEIQLKWCAKTARNRTVDRNLLS